MNHTPGPWSVVDTHPNRSCLYINGPAPLIEGDVATVYMVDGLPNREADARLIAAAPTLLDVLKDRIADLRTLYGTDEGVERAIGRAEWAETLAAVKLATEGKP